MEGIKRQFGMVRDHQRLHREKLTDDGVVSRILPVDSAEDIRTGIVMSVPATIFGIRHCSRHSYRHGGRRHAIQDILDELVARLHLSTRPVEGHQIRYHSLKEPQELGCALNRVVNLQPHDVTPWSTDMLGFNL